MQPFGGQRLVLRPRRVRQGSALVWTALIGFWVWMAYVGLTLRTRAATELTVSAAVVWTVAVGLLYQRPRLVVSEARVGIVRALPTPIGVGVHTARRSKIAQLQVTGRSLIGLDAKGRAILVLSARDWGHHAETLAEALEVPLDREPQ